MKNELLRTAMFKNEIRNYQLADILGISEATMTRRFRVEMSKAEQKRIIQLIEESKKKETIAK